MIGGHFHHEVFDAEHGQHALADPAAIRALIDHGHPKKLRAIAQPQWLERGRIQECRIVRHDRLEILERREIRIGVLGGCELRDSHEESTEIGLVRRGVRIALMVPAYRRHLFPVRRQKEERTRLVQTVAVGKKPFGDIGAARRNRRQIERSRSLSRLRCLRRHPGNPPGRDRHQRRRQRHPQQTPP